MKFYLCEKCGNLVAMINASGAPMTCCGQKMTELVAGTVDASREKHIPVVNVENGVVTATVGSVEHPMTPEHLIEWICLETTKGFKLEKLTSSDRPLATFVLADGEEPVAVYEYCNLHGLWKADI